MATLNFAGTPLSYNNYTEAPTSYTPSSFQLSPVEPTAPEESNEFVKGVQRGIRELPALAAGTVGLLGDLVNAPVLRDWGYDQYLQWMESANAYSPKVANLEDIEDVDTFLDWLSGTAGSVLPSIVGAVASSGAGALIGVGGKAAFKGLSKEAIKGRIMSEVKRQFAKGATSHIDAVEKALAAFGKTPTGELTREALMKAASSSAVKQAAKLGTQAGIVGFSGTMEAGGNWIDDFETNQDGTNPAGDLMFGVASGLTDLFGAEGLAIRNIFGTSAAKKLAAELGTEAAKNVERGFAKTAVREISKSMLAEGAQEAVQESLSAMNSYLNANGVKEFVTPELFSRLANAAAGGAVGGLFYGAPQGVFAGFSARKQANLIREEESRKAADNAVPEHLKQQQSEYQIELQAVSDQVSALNDKSAALAEEINFNINNPSAVVALSAQKVAIDNQVKELTDAHKQASDKLASTDKKIQASLSLYNENLKKRSEEQNRLRGIKDAAYSKITAQVEGYRNSIADKLERMRKAGAKQSELDFFKNSWANIEARAADIVNTIELKIPAYESYKINPYVEEKLSTIRSLAAKANQHFEQYSASLANIDKEQQARIERSQARGRAYQRGMLDAAKEELAFATEAKAKDAKQRQDLRAIQEAELLRRMQSIRGGVADITGANEIANTMFGTQNATVEPQVRNVPVEVKVQDNKKASMKELTDIQKTVINQYLDKFRLKSLEGAKTLNDVSRIFAKKMSAKGMPYTFEEAKATLDVLLPNALNMRPDQGIEWLKNNLLILNPKQAKEFYTKYNRKAPTASVKAFQATLNGVSIIGILDSKSKGAFFHETAHVYLDNLVSKVEQGVATPIETRDLNTLRNWLGVEEGQTTLTVPQQEQFADGFENYLRTGKAPSVGLREFFKRAKQWLIDLYNNAKFTEVNISPEVKDIYDRLILGPKQPDIKVVKATPKVVIKKTTPIKNLEVKELPSKTKETAKEIYGQSKRALARATDKESGSLKAKYVNESGDLDWTWADSVKESLQDYYHPIRLLIKGIKEKGGDVNSENNLWKIEEAIPNSMVERLKLLKRDFIKPLISSIEAYAKSNGGDTKTVHSNIDRYLHAIHAEERNAHLKSLGNTDPAPSGMSDKTAQEIKKGKEFPITPELKEVARHVLTLGRYQLETIEKNNLLPKDIIKKLRSTYRYYVTLKGWEGFNEEVDPQYKTRGRSAKVELARALGRKEGSNPDSPLINQILQTIQIESAAEKVKSERALLNLINDNKNTEGIDNFFFKIEDQEDPKQKWKLAKDGSIELQYVKPFSKKDNVFTVTDFNGNRVRIRAANSRVFKAFTGRNLVASHPIINLIGKLTRTMAKFSTTWNPAFIVTNPIRDITTALINVTDEKLASKTFSLKEEPVRRTIMKYILGLDGHSSAVKAIHNHLTGKPVPAEWKQVLRIFRANGGFSEQYDLNDYQSIKKGIENSINTSLKKKDVFGYIGEMGRRVLDLLEMNSNALENMTRLSAFRSLSEMWIAKGMDPTLAYKRAASAARNITVNFSKRGAWGPVISPLFMFANASIQSTARMFKTMLRNPKASAIILGGGMAGLFMLAELNRLWGGDDDDGVPHYDKVPDWVKNNNFVIMMPGGNYVKIPMPYGYNVFNVFAQTFSQLLHGNKNIMEGAMEVINSGFDNFSPVGSPEAGWTTILPTVARPPFQIATNKGFFGQKIMPDVPTWIKRDYPDSQRYWSTVSPVAKWLAQTLNAISGGNEVRPGVVDISPETIEHYVESYTGGLGKLMTRTLGTMTTLSNAMFTDGPELKINEVMAEFPVFRRMFGVTNFYSTLHEYNKQKAEVETLKAEFEIAKAEGTESAREFIKDNPNFRQKSAIARAYDKRLRNLRKTKNSIMNSQRVGEETARLEKLRKLEEKYIKEMIKKIRELD